MCNVTFKGNPVKLKGLLPAVGSTAPNFNLTAADLADTTLESFKRKTKILSIVPVFRLL